MAEIENKKNLGKTVFSWEVKEYDQHERTTGWYIVLAIICLALIIFAVSTANFLFAIIILLFAFIVVLREFYAAETLGFKITDSGIILADKFLPYKSINNFYIIYEPPQVKVLYISTGSLRPAISINLGDQNPIKIREFLLKYIEEDLDKTDENISDTLNRLFRI